MSRRTAIQSVYHIQLASLEIKRKEVDTLGLFSKPISEKILKLIGKGEFTPEEIEAIKEAIEYKEETLEDEVPKEEETPPAEVPKEDESETTEANASNESGEEPDNKDETSDSETPPEETPASDESATQEEQPTDDVGTEEKPSEEQPKVETPQVAQVTIEMINEQKEVIAGLSAKISSLEELISKLSVSTEVSPDEVSDDMVGLSGKGKSTGGNLYSENDRMTEVRKKLGKSIS
jgi:hypothetical protein